MVTGSIKSIKSIKSYNLSKKFNKKSKNNFTKSIDFICRMFIILIVSCF